MHRVVVVGAGPAGLATSYALTRAGIDHLVLEAGEIGQTWATLYDSLVLHTGKHMSALPGLPLPRSTPLFPSRQLFLDYLRDYAERHALPIRTQARVTRASRGRPLTLSPQAGRGDSENRGSRVPDDGGAGWTLDLANGERLQARALVWCTGIVSNPQTPEWPGRDGFRGEVLHSVAYRRPEPFRDRRVLIVGNGNSGGEIAADLASAGVPVTLAVRSGSFVVPRQIAGVPIQYLASVLSLLPRRAQFTLQRTMTAIGTRIRGPSGLPLPDAPRLCHPVPLIGFHLTEAIRTGRVQVRPALQEWLPHGVRFADGREEPFDVVLLATGFRPALAPLDGFATRDACGFANRRNRVVSLDQPDLYFVGQTYDTRGALFTIGRDAHRVARTIASQGEGAAAR